MTEDLRADAERGALEARKARLLEELKEIEDGLARFVTKADEPIEKVTRTTRKRAK